MGPSFTRCALRDSWGRGGTGIENSCQIIWEFPNLTSIFSVTSETLNLESGKDRFFSELHLKLGVTSLRLKLIN